MSDYLPESVWRKMTIENFGIRLYTRFSSNRNGNTLIGENTYDPTTGHVKIFLGANNTMSMDVAVYCWYAG